MNSEKLPGAGGDAPAVAATVVAPDHTPTPLAELVSLTGRVAVVTGAARGIGRAIATRFVEAGATVVIADREGAAAAVDELAPHGAVSGIELDVTDSAAVTGLVESLVAEHGRLDVWVNNAGVFPSSPLHELTDDEWRRVHAVNLDAAFFGAREASRAMIATGSRGVIINLSSVSGYRGRRGLAHYSSSKHAIRGLTRSLAVELGPRGIRAVAIAPTMVATPGTEEAARAAGVRLHSTDVYEHLPLGRPGLPDDIARVALFAASDLAAFVTGTTLIVDAGQMSV